MAKKRIKARDNFVRGTTAMNAIKLKMQKNGDLAIECVWNKKKIEKNPEKFCRTFAELIIGTSSERIHDYVAQAVELAGKYYDMPEIADTINAIVKEYKGEQLVVKPSDQIFVNGGKIINDD